MADQILINPEEFQKEIDTLSSVTKNYKKLLAQDAKNLEVIKSEWMALDSFIGLHGEWISGSNKIGQK